MLFVSPELKYKHLLSLFARNRNGRCFHLFSFGRICEDYVAKAVRSCELLRSQLPLLPAKVLTAVQTRMTFYRPSKKQKDRV